jgi:hypothetical protein
LPIVGNRVGVSVDPKDGKSVGVSVEAKDGYKVGTAVTGPHMSGRAFLSGTKVGRRVGSWVGAKVGVRLDCCEGSRVGVLVGSREGCKLGVLVNFEGCEPICVGTKVGMDVLVDGVNVGTSVVNGALPRLYSMLASWNGLSNSTIFFCARF